MESWSCRRKANYELKRTCAASRKASWSFIAIASPIAAYAFLLLSRTSDPGNMAEGLKVILVLGVGSIAGFVASCVAAIRKEKPVGLLLLGFFVSLLPVAAMLFSILARG